MEVALTQQKNTNKKENKENTQPTHGSKSFIKANKTSVGPLQRKGYKKEETINKKDSLTAKCKQADGKPVLGDALKKGKTLPKHGNRLTHSQVFLTKQVEKPKKTAADVLKPPATVQSSKSAPGMYKGRIVESKIGSIWKSSDAVGTADPKSESQRLGNAAKNDRSQSITEMSMNNKQNPVLMRSKSVSDKPAQLTKTHTIYRNQAGSCSSRPPVRSISATSMSARSRNTSVLPVNSTESKNTKPKNPATDKKVNKPASTLSQYRFSMETAEERRAKLAEWLASKGKALKRPALTATAHPKIKVSAKTKAEVQSEVQPRLAAQCKPEAEPSLQMQNLQPDVGAHQTEDQDDGIPTQSQTPGIINTSLDLLENSDTDTQNGVEDVVVNLCEALEAMTPFGCSDELTQVKDECDTKGIKPEDDEELKNEMVKMEEAEDDEELEEESDDSRMETPETCDASVIKYSVKTTPYLQSVKKTIEGEVGSSTSRRKSNIKDLKFLTPVRRSSRIQRQSSRLPTMLVDHDPCVSSLAELVKLDDDPNAYIYRKNPALLQELPDQNGL